MLLPGTTGLGEPELVTARSALAQLAPDCAPGFPCPGDPDTKMPGCPLVAPYASSASVVHPGAPPLTPALTGAEDVKITPPPPPAPGPCRLPGNVPGVSSGQVTPPFPPTAKAVRVETVPLFVNTMTVPPAPPPPPPSFSVSSAFCPFEVIDPVPVIVPAWMMMIPPPAVPLLLIPEQVCGRLVVVLPPVSVVGFQKEPLFDVPAPRPPPMTIAFVVTGNATPPSPPTIPALLQPNPPVPPVPPFAPPPPPLFWSFAVGSASVAPPPAFPGAPRAKLPFG